MRPWGRCRWRRWCGRQRCRHRGGRWGRHWCTTLLHALKYGLVAHAQLLQRLNVLGDGVRVVVAAVVVQVVEVVVAQVVEVVEVLVVVVVAAGAFARPVASQTSWGRTCRVLLAAEDR